MNHMLHDDDRYLWDRSAPADPTAAVLERTLGDLAFDPHARPLRQPGRRWVRFMRTVGVAACLILAAGTSLHVWRLTWPTGRPWTVLTKDGPEGATITSFLQVGPSFVTTSSNKATVRIARIGSMLVGADSTLSLEATSSAHHRIELARGTLQVRLWAPPGQFVVRTPAGDVIDLGCQFRLEVEGGTARLGVDTGWVQLSNELGESLVPAGASSLMTADRAPLVPIFDDAPEPFRRAVREFERANTPDDRKAALAVVLSRARERDVLTLLALAGRTSLVARSDLVSHAAALSPPPHSISLADVATGDDDALWRWREALPLPPVKSWWRNWPDLIASFR